MATGWTSGVIGSVKPIEPVAVTTGAATIYTAPGNTANITAGYATAELKSLSITNTTGAAINVNVYIIPSGGAAGTGNIYLSSVAVNGNDTKILTGLQEALAAGDFIQVSASAAGLTIRGAVVEVQ